MSSARAWRLRRARRRPYLPVSGARLGLLAGVLASCAAGAHARPADGAGLRRSPWRVGVARVDITPPPFDSGADARSFANCPAALDGRRPVSFEEPYKDLMGTGQYEFPDPYCDANANGRYDGVYLSGGADHLLRRVHDAIDARAVAFSDQTRTVVLVSVVAQGLYENYTRAMRDMARALNPSITDVIVSANHNESSPDTVGIYGGPDVGAGVGLRSGIDDYYMSFLVDRVAHAAADAAARLRPASLWARQFPVPANVRIALSNNFPTTDDRGVAAAIDPKVGVLQARDPGGHAIFTLMSLAAHNQEIGHSRNDGYDVSADWPGYFQRGLEARVGSGLAIFLVGDNGSEEDPQTVPPVPAAAGAGCPNGCYEQARATGEALAASVAGQSRSARRLGFGPLVYDTANFCVPLENNLFKVAAVAGLFGQRQTFACNGDQRIALGGAGGQLQTSVSVLDVGPDLQFIANPGEAFPALLVGSPWGIDQAGCPDRPNPPVPTWHAHAAFRLQVGLANDLVGYLLPAWGFSSQPGTYLTSCQNDAANRDPRGHQHKLEDESVGPTAGNLIAEALSRLLDRRPDPTAHIGPGRFIAPDGSVSRDPRGAVGVWLPSQAGSPTRRPTADHGTLIAIPGVTRFGARTVDTGGTFMDYDGARQPAADITTRGMLVTRADGRPSAHFYLDVYPNLRTPTFGAAMFAARSCRRAVARVQRASGARGALRLGGSARRRTCLGRLRAVEFAIAQRRGRRCRALLAGGRLGSLRSCRARRYGLARGLANWSLVARRPAGPGVYVIWLRAIYRPGGPGPASRIALRIAR